MYVVLDPFKVPFAKYAYNYRFKNSVLKYWPKQTVITQQGEFVDIFSFLMLWQSSVGPFLDHDHLKLYNLLNISTTDIITQDHSGLDGVLIDVSVSNSDLYTVNTADIISYINTTTPLIYPSNPDVFNSDPDPYKVNDPDITNDIAINDYLTHNPDPYKDNPVYTEEYLATITRNPDGSMPAGVLPEPQWDSQGWVTDYLLYNPDTPNPTNISDTLLLAEAGSNNALIVDIKGLEFTNPVFFIALKDTTNTLYERKFKITEKRFTVPSSTIGHSHTWNFNVNPILIYAVIEVKYRRILDANDSSVSTLIANIQTDIANLDAAIGHIDNVTFAHTGKYTKPTFEAQYGITLGLQDGNRIRLLHSLFNLINGQDPADYLVYNPAYAVMLFNQGGGLLRVDKLTAMRAKVFIQIFMSSLHMRSPEKKADAWHTFVNMLVMVVGMFTAVITQNYELIPLILGLTSIAEIGLSMLWQSLGDYAAAGQAGGMAQMLGQAAAILGAIVFPFELTATLFAVDYILKELNVGPELRMVAQLIIMVSMGGTENSEKSDSLLTGLTKVLKNPESFDIGRLVAEEIDKITSTSVTEIIQDVTDNIGEEIDKLSDSFEKITLTNLLSGYSVSDWLKALNMGFNAFAVHEDKSDEINAKQAVVNAQNAELAAGDTHEAIEVVERVWASPYENWIDTNYPIERMPVDLTHGLNANLMNKYFNSGY